MEIVVTNVRYLLSLDRINQSIVGIVSRTINQKEVTVVEADLVEIEAVADLVVVDCHDRATAVAELASPLWGFKRGRMTFTRKPAELHRPS